MRVASQFWEKYIEKTKLYKISPGSIRWYVKRAEDYIKAHPGLPLAQHSDDNVKKYLNGLGRNSRLSDWQFRQAVDALRILFVDIVRSQWAAKFSWCYWIESSTHLPHSHATVARAYESLPSESPVVAPRQPEDSMFHKDINSDNSVISKASTQFPEHFSRLITRIRSKQYSIRTEQAYVNWLARYIVFHKMQDPDKLDGLSINTYLEFLVVKRHVSARRLSENRNRREGKLF